MKSFVNVLKGENGSLIVLSLIYLALRVVCNVIDLITINDL